MLHASLRSMLRVCLLSIVRKPEGTHVFHHNQWTYGCEACLFISLFMFIEYSANFASLKSEKILGKPDGTNVFRSSQWRFRRPTCLNHFRPHDSTGHVTVLQCYSAKPLSTPWQHGLLQCYVFAAIATRQAGHVDTLSYEIFVVKCCCVWIGS